MHRRVTSERAAISIMCRIDTALAASVLLRGRPSQCVSSALVALRADTCVEIANRSLGRSAPSTGGDAFDTPGST